MDNLKPRIGTKVLVKDMEVQYFRTRVFLGQTPTGKFKCKNLKTGKQEQWNIMQTI